MSTKSGKQLCGEDRLVCIIIIIIIIRRNIFIEQLSYQSENVAQNAFQENQIRNTGNKKQLR